MVKKKERKEGRIRYKKEEKRDGTTRVHRVRFTPLTLCRLKTNSPTERKKKEQFASAT